MQTRLCPKNGSDPFTQLIEGELKLGAPALPVLIASVDFLGKAIWEVK
jgi:hypothetical protein